MKVIFHKHYMGATIQDVVAEEKVFCSLKKLFEYIEQYSKGAIKVKDILIEYLYFDERVGYDVYGVLIKRCNEKDYMRLYRCPQMYGYCYFAKNPFRSIFVRNRIKRYFRQKTERW